MLRIALRTSERFFHYFNKQNNKSTHQFIEEIIIRIHNENNDLLQLDATLLKITERN